MRGAKDCQRHPGGAGGEGGDDDDPDCIRVCPEAGRPRFFGNTKFEFDMSTYYKKDLSGNPVLQENNPLLPPLFSYYKKPSGPASTRQAWRQRYRGDSAAAPRDRKVYRRRCHAI